jgi:predicted acyltransferase (DUF342 family)
MFKVSVLALAFLFTTTLAFPTFNDRDGKRLMAGNIPLGSSSRWPLPSGEYKFPGDITLAAEEVLHLSDSNYKFFSRQNINFGAGSRVSVTSGGVGFGNIQWTATSNVVLGAAAFVPGDIISGGYASVGASADVFGGVKAGTYITTGAMSRVVGKLMTDTGDITMGAKAESADVESGGAFTGGEGTTTGTITSNGIMSIGANAKVRGYILKTHDQKDVTPIDHFSLSAGGAITQGVGVRCNNKICLSTPN